MNRRKFLSGLCALPFAAAFGKILGCAKEPEPLAAPVSHPSPTIGDYADFVYEGDKRELIDRCVVKCGEEIARRAASTVNAMLDNPELHRQLAAQGLRVDYNEVKRVFGESSNG